MKALVKTKEGPGNVQLMEVAEPKAKPGEVKIRVAAVGICGTDIKIYHGDTWSNPPVILGHEYSGIVEEVGAGVTKVKVGDRVISETAQKICGNCYYCNTSNQLMCPERLSIGYGTDGAMATFCVVREGIIHKLPDSISLDDAAVCEPAAVAVHAVYDTVKLYPTDLAVVMGPGPIGLLVAQLVKGFGCTTVLAGTDKDLERLAIGKKLGIDHALDITKVDLIEEVNKLTNGMGADVVYDCTGAAPAIRSGMSALKKMGKFVQVGLTKQSLEIEYALLTQREISIIGTFGHNWKSWETVLQLIREEKLNVSALVTHHFKLEDWEEAFAVAERQEGIKLLLHP
ncbi:MAG TPA: zinc-binding dehydrogenase [Anaerovoracaceae bacterium]|nr:zinc-binding dehydrogenase [Anaerovoracaceae bacterium]